MEKTISLSQQKTVTQLNNKTQCNNFLSSFKKKSDHIKRCMHAIDKMSDHQQKANKKRTKNALCVQKKQKAKGKAKGDCLVQNTKESVEIGGMIVPVSDNGLLDLLEKHACKFNNNDLEYLKNHPKESIILNTDNPHLFVGVKNCTKKGKNQQCFLQQFNVKKLVVNVNGNTHKIPNALDLRRSFGDKVSLSNAAKTKFGYLSWVKNKLVLFTSMQGMILGGYVVLRIAHLYIVSGLPVPQFVRKCLPDDIDLLKLEYAIAELAKYLGRNAVESAKELIETYVITTAFANVKAQVPRNKDEWAFAFFSSGAMSSTIAMLLSYFFGGKVL